LPFPAHGRDAVRIERDNASDREPAAIIAFYLTDTEGRPLIEVLQPK